MIIVLDTSAAVEILLKKEDSEKYRKKISEADAVIAPELYISEITNVAWKYNKLAGFSHEESYELAQDGINIIDQFINSNDLWKEALREAMNNNHPVYDCLYIICARRNDGILMTKDKKLQQLCKKLQIEVI